MLWQRVNTCLCLRRFISSSIVNYNFCLNREGKFMKKMINAEIPKKKWRPSKDGTFAPIIAPALTTKTNTHVTRRVTVLNKLFMKYITDLMATGEISNQILGRGIEVSRVNITSDFKLVKVFWFSSNNNAEELEEVTAILHESAYRLRHELSRLKVIGVVPPIQFCQDKQLANAFQLEKNLLIADYGDDYTPTVKPMPQPELTLFTKIPDNIREKIVKLDSDENIDDDDDMYNADLPSMTHDVLDLDHWRIMSRVRQPFSKAMEMDKNRISISSSPEIQQQFISTGIESLRSDDEVDAFNAFLLGRKIAEKRRRARCNELLNPESLMNDEPDDFDNSNDYGEFELDDIDDDDDGNNSSCEEL